MDEKTFRSEIECGLKQLSPRQQRRFAWRCAVRVLPFLSGRDCYFHFYFWRKATRQKHLQAVFYALDVGAAEDDDVDILGILVFVGRVEDLLGRTGPISLPAT